MVYLGLFIVAFTAIVLFSLIITLVWLAVDKFMEWKRGHDEKEGHDE